MYIYRKLKWRNVYFLPFGLLFLFILMESLPDIIERYDNKDIEYAITNSIRLNYDLRESINCNKSNFSLLIKDKSTLSRENIFEIWFTLANDKHTSHWLHEVLPVFNRTTFLWYYSLLDTVFKTLTVNNVSFMLYHGSLLGSLRHHGPIPWDDDLDILVPIEKKQFILGLFNTIPGYRAVSYSTRADWRNFFKKRNWFKIFHSNDSLVIEGKDPKKQKWPSVDVFFYKIIHSDMLYIDDSSVNSKLRSFKLSQFLPPNYKIFWNWILPVPWDYHGVINTLFNDKICKGVSWSHREEKRILKRPIEIDCHLLHPLYPFVKRVKSMGDCLEHLVKDGKIIHTINCS